MYHLFLIINIVDDVYHTFCSGVDGILVFVGVDFGR